MDITGVSLIVWLGNEYGAPVYIVYLWITIGNAFRFGMLGVADIPVTTAFSIILVCIVGLTIFALYLLNKGTGIRN